MIGCTGPGCSGRPGGPHLSGHLGGLLSPGGPPSSGGPPSLGSPPSSGDPPSSGGSLSGGLPLLE